MGDRFYQQQLKALGTCPGAPLGKRKADKAPTKAELASGIPVDISALTKTDIEKVLAAQKVPVGIPTGRLKKPYIEELNKFESSVDWSKLTVAKMIEVLVWVDSMK